MVWLALIGVLLAALVAGSLWAGVRAVRGAGRKASAAAAERLRAGGLGAEHILAARLVGHTLPGVSALRGAGALALTRRSVRFQLALPDRALEVPLADLAATRVTTTGRAGSKVVLVRRDGATVSFVVDDGDLWPELLRAGGPPPPPTVR